MDYLGPVPHDAVTSLGNQLINRSWKFREGGQTIENARQLVGHIDPNYPEFDIRTTYRSLVRVGNRDARVPGMQELVKANRITAGTLVWDDYTHEWRPFDDNIRKEILDPYGTAAELLGEKKEAKK